MLGNPVKPPNSYENFVVPVSIFLLLFGGPSLSIGRFGKG
ncbi:hypothetical protein CKA32_004881 [Geitlerinema sp. FC II]|nr:hypothetical protein CKA32_004881 [Geitlerinema sp. FC II]